MGHVNVNFVLYLASAILCLIGALLMPEQPKVFWWLKMVFLIGATGCLFVAFIMAGGLELLAFHK